jgi:ribonuclease BN (tRNA processing enzyme)
VRLTVVGCSGSLPGPRSAASCYLVEQDGYALVLDLGSGAVGELSRYVDPAGVGAVLLSHLHADHFMDLCGMYVALRYAPGASPSGPPRPDRLPVHGPLGTGERIAAAYGVPLAELEQVLSFTVVRPGTTQIGPFEVTAAPAVHPVPSHALRLTADGRCLVYTGDTAPSVDVDALAAGADLLLAEASFTRDAVNPPGLHLTARQAGEMAERAQVGKLVVTHVPPWYEPASAVAEAATAYHGPCVGAASGMVIEL